MNIEHQTQLMLQETLQAQLDTHLVPVIEFLHETTPPGATSITTAHITVEGDDDAEQPTTTLAIVHGDVEPSEVRQALEQMHTSFTAVALMEFLRAHYGDEWIQWHLDAMVNGANPSAPGSMEVH